jgi:hypothetical protein
MSHSDKDNQNSIPPSLVSLAILLGGDSGFSDAMENGASMDCLNDMVKQAAATVGFQFPSDKSKQQAYDTVFSNLGRHNSSTLFGNPHAQKFVQLLRNRQAKMKATQKSRRNFARRMGIMNKEPELQYPSDLKVIYLDRLPENNIYPPFDHHILERPYPVLPPPPKVHDRTCAYSDKYHVLDESMLQYTVGEDESAIIFDRTTKELVAVVVRGFVKSYYNSVEEWSSALILETLNRRRPVLRNNPGMVQLGVSTGSRQAPLFGWVRNLYDKYKKSNDCQTQDQHLSSLFGFFYSFVRGQLPIIASKFEDILVKPGVPRYDQYDSQQFTLPFANGPTFHCPQLAPPEGYVSHNFSRQIHRDGHWKDCHVGVYWSIIRKHINGRIGKESGGNFFVADYGLRIINATNSCIGWDISLTHGTGVLENGLDQLTITSLLSRKTELSWASYEKKYKEGLLQPHELLWPEFSSHE